jgi:hypothetical protein
LKKLIRYFVIILATFFLLGCSSRIQHADSFYNGAGEFTYARFPLIKPYDVYRMDGDSPWEISGVTGLWAPSPNDWYDYWNLHDVQKLSVKNEVIMVYTPYVDVQADQSIKEKYFHWFVIIPEKNVAAGFENEGAFLDYIQQFGIQQPDWREPDEIYKEFERTGCLNWIPDCN